MMSKEYTFAALPSVSISRSRFARKSQHKTSFNLGEIVPIYVDEVLPGDTRSMDLASLVRMSTPIAPIMDNIYLDFYAFFVPNRLVWEHWKAFMGENESSAGIPQVSYSIPYCSNDDDEAPTQVGSIWDHFGLPVIDNNGQGISLANLTVSALPFRGYALIYNEWFRNQNVIAPLAIQKGDTDEVLIGDAYASAGGDFISAGCLKASKLADYFTSALPYAQKGAAVSIPLGTTAPIIAGTASSLHDMGNTVVLNNKAQSLVGSNLNLGLAYTNLVAGGTGISGSYLQINQSNLFADLSTATAATINQLRYAFQLQKLLEKDALYGSRYWEILASHFGIMAPDASLQRPEYLGGHRMRINVDQVLSTAGYDDTSATDLGKPGANSVSSSKMSLFTKSFVEHGYLFILAVARHDSTYGQGVNRMWTRRNRYDFYFPVFANLGAQEVRNKEIFATGNSIQDDAIFGYQEAWAEYRFKPSISTGLLNPANANSLDYWTLGEKFASLPTLGKTFIEQGRGNLARALATGVSGPDFIGDFYFQDIAVRPMPMYSIPGLIDHH